MVDPHRIQDQYSVALDHPEVMVVELHVEEGVGAEIAQLPDLPLAGSRLDRRVGVAVERLGARVAILEAGKGEVLEHHHPLAQTDQLGILLGNEPVDDEHSRHARADLVVDIGVHVGVVPVQPERVVLGDRHIVAQALIRLDPDEHIVPVRQLRRDVHAMIVDVGGLGPLDIDLGGSDLVHRLEADDIAPPHPQRRRHVVAVDDIGQHLAPAHRDLGWGDRQRAAQDAVDAAQFRRIRQIVDRLVRMDRDGRARARQTEPGAGALVHWPSLFIACRSSTELLY